MGSAALYVFSVIWPILNIFVSYRFFVLAIRRAKSKTAFVGASENAKDGPFQLCAECK
jgi:hypothetical protein